MLRKALTASVLGAILLTTMPAGSAADPPLTKVVIQLGSVPAAAWAPIYVAKSDGLFAKEGLDVEILPGKTSQDALTSVAAGTVTMAIVLTFTVMLSAEKGLPVVSVASFQGRNSYGIVGAVDKGIKSLKDLAGKRVLITGPVYETLLRALIKRAGGNPDLTTYVFVPNPSSLLGTYVDKQADAIETVIPYARSSSPESGRRIISCSPISAIRNRATSSWSAVKRSTRKKT